MSETKFDEFVSKGWGYEKIIVNGPFYCGKILHFVKGRSCSSHYHVKKTETFYISFGKILVQYFNDEERAREIIRQESEWSFLENHCEKEILEKGDYFHLEPGLVHKMTALEDSEIIEFSTTDYKDDSYRLIKGD
jgi:quercetin dioxygenase-like cupin family protein